MPPSQFEVEGEWQSWAVDGRGNVLYYMEVSKIPRRVQLHSAKKFNVEEYKERNGKWPSRTVPLDQISYWDHWGNYHACGGETQRPRQEAEDPKSVLKHVGALEQGHGEHKAEAKFMLVARGSNYVLDWHGCITQYNWRNEQSDNVYTFSGQWKFTGMSFHNWANHIVAPWERIRNALVTGEKSNFQGYVWDVDHGTTRRWGGTDAKGKVFISGNWWRMERGAPVAEAEDPKAFLKQLNADAKRGFSVRCYMGDWLVDRNGRVLAWGPDTWNGQSAEGDDPAFAAWARSIVKFDFDEWEQHYGQRLPDTLDVCDLGSWTRKGEYVPPEEDWRRDNAEGRI